MSGWGQQKWQSHQHIRSPASSYPSGQKVSGSFVGIMPHQLQAQTGPFSTNWGNLGSSSSSPPQNAPSHGPLPALALHPFRKRSQLSCRRAHLPTARSSNQHYQASTSKGQWEWSTGPFVCKSLPAMATFIVGQGISLRKTDKNKCSSSLGITSLLRYYMAAMEIFKSSVLAGC